MSSCVVIGAQWGDEGKGKIVDRFAREADIVARFQGGNNAGHTLVVDDGTGPKKTVLHLIPSGILHDEKINLIASGVVVDVEVLFEELAGLATAGRDVKPGQLRISRDAHVVMPYHKSIDLAREARLEGSKIGTTGRGIGPTYEDKAARRGVRVRDLLSADRLRWRLERVLPERNAVLAWLGEETYDLDELVTTYVEYGRRLAPFCCDCRQVLDDALSGNGKVLFEGAQGTMLDIGHGTYPFVTSSYTTSGGVCVGAGVAPNQVKNVVGIAKAYCTRVGAGPFPTELEDEVGQRLRDIGHEYGATTGRPRRCGWFDAVAMRAAHRLNGFDYLAVTKLDVLSGLDTLKVCVAYDVHGERVHVADMDVDSLEAAIPVYEELPGWTEELVDVTTIEGLPVNARAYLDRLEELTGVTIGIVSIGPRRDQTILLFEPFEE